MSERESRSQFFPVFLRLSETASAVVFGTGCVALIGWIAGIPLLTSLSPQMVPMKPNAALSFVLIGLSLWLLQEKRASGASRTVGKICAFGAALTGLLTLGEYAGWNNGIDHMLVNEPAGAVLTGHPGRMAPNSALSFAILGSALVLLDLRGKGNTFPVRLCLWAVAVISLLSIIGYIYGIKIFYFGIASYTTMSLHCSVTFIFAALGVLFARPQRGLVSVLASTGMEGSIARRFLPFAIGFPLVFGWLVLTGERRGYYGGDFGTTLLSLGITIVSGIFIYWTSLSIQRIERRRREAEEDLVKAKELAEERAKEAEQGRLIVETSKDYIVRFDRDLRYLYVNPAFAEMSGHPSEWFGGRKYGGPMHGQEAHDLFGEGLTNTLETGRRQERELSVKMRGRTRYYNVHFIPHVESGDVRSIIAISRDITDLKAAEDVLLRSKEMLEQAVSDKTRELIGAHLELERAKRMADIGRLASTIAHEMRNPLGAINTALFNLWRKNEDVALNKHLATIEKKVLEGSQIINNLLNFARIKPSAFEQVSLLRTLEECARTISHKYDGGDITLEAVSDCPDDALTADPTQLAILFSNILDNAFQSLPGKKGTVTLSARRNVNGCFEVVVRDTGTGIDQEDIGRIFEPFFTRKSKGTGLGLAICKQIVELHRGTIEVESVRGSGTTFRITLPGTGALAVRPAHEHDTGGVNAHG